MTKISIIIPAYKRVKQTLKTINYLFSSEGFGRQFQAEIIVADSSPDEELKKALAQKFGDKIIYVRPKKPGIATNKNEGAKIAKNPILIFCDSDMEVEKETLLKTLQALKKHPTATAVTGQVIWRGGPKDSQHDRPRPEDRQLTVKKTTYVEAIYSRYIVTYKKIFWKVGGYDEVVFNMRGEGSDLSVRYWRAGYPLVYDPLIIVHHVYDVEEGIIRGVKHPEWGIAKDLLILAYKYDILDEKYRNFAHTVKANFEKLNNGYYNIIQGIAKYLNFITEIKPKIDQEKKRMTAEFDFKFLEIFSEKKLFNQCIQQAEKKISSVRRFLF